MRWLLSPLLAASVLLVLLSSTSSAQEPAAKVTIEGLVDFVTAAYKNMSHGFGPAGAAPGQPDVTDAKERGWYSRERGLFTITGEVGKVKGVWAIELDFTNGAGNFNASSQPGSLTTIGIAGGPSANFDLDTDIQGAVETKWLYLEAPITGPGSFLPFIPVTTIGRFGGQPFRGYAGRADKFGILASGDFAGVTLETSWTPDVRSTLTYVQIGEALDRFIAPNQKEQIAILASVELDVSKTLTVRPMYAYAFYHGGNCGTLNLGTAAYGGYNPNTNCPPITAGSLATPGGVGRDIERHYLGGDFLLTSGPFSLSPTFIYLLGTQEVANRSGIVNRVDVRSFIADTVAGYRTGPLSLETRVAYTPGVGANHDVQNGGGGVIRAYQPINSGFGYMALWTEIWSIGVDYGLSLFNNRSGLVLRESPSFDKYGRLFVAFRVEYQLTPALTLRGITNVSWTDTAVDTKGTLAAGIVPSGITTAGNPFHGGKERYLGNEWVLGLTYRFVANVVFDLAAAALFTGDALNIQRPATAGCVTHGIPTCQSRDVFKGTARVRVTF